MKKLTKRQRNQDDLFRRVKSSCDSYRIIDTGSEAAQSYVKDEDMGRQLADTIVESNLPFKASTRTGTQRGV